MHWFTPHIGLELALLTLSLGSATWQRTPTERDVAALILKGIGHKQIAAAMGRSERTVRQHPVRVYDKSGLAGRAELAAFCLEGLSLPVQHS